MLPSIAIMDYFDNRYENVANITPLYFPIYCSKLYHTFLEALHLSQEEDTSLLPNEPKRRYFKGNVLVAEDNSANQELIKMILERYGLHYLIAADGQEAVMRYKSGHFDLILMDEQMPRKSGSQATAEIRKFEKSHEKSRIPIVALTANVLKGEKEKSKEKGFDAFLGKPIILKEMEEVLQEFLVEEGSTEHQEREDTKRVNTVDVSALAEELMLEEAQVIHLLDVYEKNMVQNIILLQEAIKGNDLMQIELIAHSIKGSSSNFRMEDVVHLASTIEQAAHNKETLFCYEEYCSKIEAYVKID